MPMMRLTKDQLRKKKHFIADYIKAENAATGSKLDANANITKKNIATLSNELVKDIYIQINREIVADKIAETFGPELAAQYHADIDSHAIYVHDESSLFPYSYCGGESCVYRLGRDVVTMSFERLWNAAGGETEEPEPGVMVRFPEGLEVLDKDGRFTAVTRIVKKVRTRPLVEVKTRFGESIVVTDNHPMIVSDDADSTIPASECAGAKQLKTDAVCAATEVAVRVEELDMRRELRDYDDMGEFVASSTECERRDACKATIRLDRDFGYVVGFFVANGYYQEDGREKKGIFIRRNDVAKLRDVASRLFVSTGVPSYVAADGKLLVPSAAIARLFSETFSISDDDAGRSLPLGMLSYPEEFRLGLLTGLVDGDGRVNGDTTTVSTVSRTLASQLAYLVRSLGMSPSMLSQRAATGAVYEVSFPSTHDVRASLTGCASGWADIAEVSWLECGDTEPYVYDITTESRTFMLNNLWVHNCVSVSMYPFLLDGLKPLGGESGAPKHLKSFVGGFINLVFAISSQFAGAVATPEFLMYFDHFARRDLGDNYLRTHGKDIANYMQQVAYSLNQPAAARGYQSVFWNVGVFDRPYFESLFGNFYFPNGDRPTWKSVNLLQQWFLSWLNAERTRALLTFPVVSIALLSDGQRPVDGEWAEVVAKEWSEGNQFFVYMSESVDSLSSCCFDGGETLRLFTDASGSHSVVMSMKDFVRQFGTGDIDRRLDTGAFIKCVLPDGAESIERIVGVLAKTHSGPMIRITVGGRTISVTPDHEFAAKLADTGEIVNVHAGEIAKAPEKYLLPTERQGRRQRAHGEGDAIMNWRRIDSCEIEIVKNKTVYDIELENGHYFPANGVISHNCRLRNGIEQNEFSYTLGAGGVATGSINVITVNVNRAYQTLSGGVPGAPIKGPDRGESGAPASLDQFVHGRIEELKTLLDRVRKYQVAYRRLMEDYLAAGLLDVYQAGFIHMEKQFLTIGVNGMLEAAEFCGLTPGNNEDYIRFLDLNLKAIYDGNREATKEWGYKFNTEFVPAENLGVKNAAWDKADGLVVARDCYNSYFYPVESEDVNILDKFVLHGRETTKWLDGGSALHLNLEEYPTKDGYLKLLDVMARTGCPYMTTNVKVTICGKCGFIDKRTLTRCSRCGGEEVDWATRIIGYLKKVKHFSADRQAEEARRRYHSTASILPVEAPSEKSEEVRAPR